MRDELLRNSLVPGQDVELAVVTFTTAEAAKAHADHFGLELPFLLDPDRRTYRALGFGQASSARVWGWRNAKRYVQLLASGGRVLDRSTQRNRQREDTSQLGGDVVIANNRLQWAYWSAGPEDRPSPAAVVDAVNRAS